MKVRVVKDHFCGTGWRAEPETLYLGGVGAVYVEKLEFVLPETWAGMAVTLHIEQEGGTVPQPMLLDGNNNAPVDGRFTTARQGLWMLMATDGEGRREMTMPGKYVCYQTLENGEGTGADGPAMPLRYQYLQLVLEQEARAALEAQRAARYRQWVADRCAAKEHALLLEALSGMRYSDASAYKIYDNKSDVITPVGEKLTAEQWLDRYQWGRYTKMIVGGGIINGSVALVFDNEVERYRKAGCDFSSCTTDEDYLAAIEAFEDNPPVADAGVSDQTRIADALEDMVALSLPDAE